MDAAQRNLISTAGFVGFVAAFKDPVETYVTAQQVRVDLLLGSLRKNGDDVTSVRVLTVACGRSSPSLPPALLLKPPV